MPFISSVRGSFGPQGRFGKRISTLGLSSSNPANNARQILTEDPSATSGNYWIKGVSGTPMQMYCDMTGSESGASVGGWMKVDQNFISTYRTGAVGENLRRCSYNGSGRYNKDDVDGYLGGFRWDFGTTIQFIGVRQTYAKLFSNNGPDGYAFNDRTGVAFGSAQGNPPRPSDAQQLSFISSDYFAGTNGTSHSWSAINDGLSSIHRYWIANGGANTTGGTDPWHVEGNGVYVYARPGNFHQSDNIGFNGRYIQWNESDGGSERCFMEEYTVWLR